MTHNPQGLAPDYHARVVVPMVQHTSAARTPAPSRATTRTAAATSRKPPRLRRSWARGADDTNLRADVRLRALIWRLYLAALLVGIGWGVAQLLPYV